MKKLVLKMIRDLGIFLIIGFLVLQLGTRKWEVNISLLTSVYVMIEVIRLIFCKEISAGFKRYPIVGLYFINWAVINLLWKDAPGELMIAMVICINITGLILMFQRKEEQETKLKGEGEEKNTASEGIVEKE